MKAKILIPFLSLLLASLIGCQKEPSIIEDQELTLRGTVPFKGDYTTHPEVVSFINGVLTLSIPAEGKATHLGKSEWYADSWVNTNQYPFLQTGAMTFTAANGDQLFGTFSGDGFPGENGLVDFEGDYVITGGTGRFQGNTGSGTYYGSATGNLGELHFEGVLNK